MSVTLKLVPETAISLISQLDYNLPSPMPPARGDAGKCHAPAVYALESGTDQYQIESRTL